HNERLNDAEFSAMSSDDRRQRHISRVRANPVRELDQERLNLLASEPSQPFENPSHRRGLQSLLARENALTRQRPIDDLSRRPPPLHSTEQRRMPGPGVRSLGPVDALAPSTGTDEQPSPRRRCAEVGGIQDLPFDAVIQRLNRRDERAEYLASLLLQRPVVQSERPP